MMDVRCWRMGSWAQGLANIQNPTSTYVSSDLRNESAVAHRGNLRRVREPLQPGAHHAGMAEVPGHHSRAGHDPQGGGDRIPDPLAGLTGVLENSDHGIRAAAVV